MQALDAAAAELAAMAVREDHNVAAMHATEMAEAFVSNISGYESYADPKSEAMARVWLPESRTLGACLDKLDAERLADVGTLLLVFEALQSTGLPFRSGCTLRETLQMEAFNCATAVAVIGALAGPDLRSRGEVLVGGDHVVMAVECIVVSAGRDGWFVRARSAVVRENPELKGWRGVNQHEVSLLFNRAITLRESGDYSASERLLREAHQSRPSTEVTKLLACTLARLDRRREAAAFFRSLPIGIDDANYHLLASAVLRDVGDDERARTHSDRAEALRPSAV